MAVYSQTELEQAAMKHFECLPEATTALRDGPRNALRIREARAISRKRDRVLRVTERYRTVMDDNPGMDRDDAIRLTIGALRLIVGFLFPWIGLAMAIAAWLWDYEHSAETVLNAG